MIIKVSKQIGNSSIEAEFEGQDEKEAIGKALFLTEPDVCGKCGSTEIIWRYSKAKGFTFVKRICSKCKYESGLGEFKEGGFYWKKWEVGFTAKTDSYQSKANANITGVVDNSESSEGIDPKKIPF